MKNMFKNNDAFDQDISSWDVSNVSDWTGMFENADAISDQKMLYSWDHFQAMQVGRILIGHIIVQLLVYFIVGCIIM